MLFKIFSFLLFTSPNTRLIYTTNDPFPIIILEDLTYDGFSAPSLPFYDIDDSKLIIQRLAQFHAASYYLSEMVNTLKLIDNVSLIKSSAE